jgi:hypothetical protein
MKTQVRVEYENGETVTCSCVKKHKLDLKEMKLYVGSCEKCDNDIYHDLDLQLLTLPKVVH